MGCRLSRALPKTRSGRSETRRSRIDVFIVSTQVAVRRLETPTRELLAATTVTYTSQLPPPMRRTRRSERPGHAAHRHLTHARLLAPLSPFALLGSREGSLHASSPDHQSV